MTREEIYAMIVDQGEGASKRFALYPGDNELLRSICESKKITATEHAKGWFADKPEHILSGVEFDIKNYKSL